MSKRSLSEEFIDMVRQAAAAQRAKRIEPNEYTYNLYCPVCHKYTFHRIEERGAYEYYYCKCGTSQVYKVG